MIKPTTTVPLGPAILIRIRARRVERFEVRVMAVAENYAMVRRKGAMPFVASVGELTPL